MLKAAATAAVSYLLLSSGRTVAQLPPIDPLCNPNYDLAGAGIVPLPETKAIADHRARCDNPQPHVAGMFRHHEQPQVPAENHQPMNRGPVGAPSGT